MDVYIEKIYFIKLSKSERNALLTEIQDDLQMYPILNKLLDAL